MEYDSLSRCLGGEMVDTRDSKSRAKERGGSSPLQGIILRMLIEWAIQWEISDRIDIDIPIRSEILELE